MRNSMRKILVFSASATMLLIASLANAVTPVIDVLVVYTQGTADYYGGNPTTRFNHLFNVTNQIYKDSAVDLRVRIAGTVKVNYTDNNSSGTALNAITQGTAPFNNIAALRTQYNADMVVLYRPYMDAHGDCGLAWIGGMGSNGSFQNPQYKSYMFSHIGITTCGDYVTSHELGHNMGLNHSRLQDGTGGTFPYALGYGVMNKFTDIMAYTSAFNVDYWTGKIYKFSNPNLLCLGEPCGINRLDPVNGADAAQTLRVTTPQIAKFFGPTCSPAAVPVPSYGISAVASCSSISVGWATVSTPSYYTLMKNGTVIQQTTQSNIKSFIDTDVQIGTSYQYSMVICSNGGSCQTATIAPTVFIPTNSYQDFATPRHWGTIIGAPLVGPVGTGWNALGTPHALNETANLFCKDQGGFGAGNYSIISNYTRGAHYYTQFGSWKNLAGVDFNQISNVRCYF